MITNVSIGKSSYLDTAAARVAMHRDVRNGIVDVHLDHSRLLKPLQVTEVLSIASAVYGIHPAAAWLPG